MSNDNVILCGRVIDDNAQLGEFHRAEGYKASTEYSDDDGSSVDTAERKTVHPSEEDENDDALDEPFVPIGTLIGIP